MTSGLHTGQGLSGAGRPPRRRGVWTRVAARLARVGRGRGSIPRLAGGGVVRGLGRASSYNRYGFCLAATADSRSSSGTLNGAETGSRWRPEPGHIGEPMMLRCLCVEPRLRISITQWKRTSGLHSGDVRRGARGASRMQSRFDNRSAHRTRACVATCRMCSAGSSATYYISAHSTLHYMARTLCNMARTVQLHAAHTKEPIRAEHTCKQFPLRDCVHSQSQGSWSRGAQPRRRELRGAQPRQWKRLRGPTPRHRRSHPTGWYKRPQRNDRSLCSDWSTRSDQDAAS